MDVGTIAGFKLRIHWSTLVIFGLLVWSLAAVQLPDQVPEASGAARIVAALVAGVAFYVGLLAHEVSHALMARREGIVVNSLTLWMLGGVASLEGEPTTPGADLRVAGIGPAVSLAAGAIAAALAVAFDAAGAPAIVVATLAWLAGINVVLAVFNLIPAAPLDGGRLLRAALWAWRGDRTWAAVTAARAGEVFGFVLVGLGLASLFLPGLGMVWFIVLGWFLLNAARAERAQAEVSDLLTGVTVGSVMTPDPVTVPATTSVAALLEEYILATRHSAFPVLDVFGQPNGIVTLGRVRSVPADRRPFVAVGDIACPPSELVTTTPQESLLDLLPRLGGCADGRALVLVDGRLVGIVTATDVTRAIEVRGEQKIMGGRSSAHLNHSA